MGDLRVLVIEDDESVLTMIEMFFQKEGISGQYVLDGLDGYERAKNEEWDCIIIDWMLPGMDGVTICRKLREANITVPIIILTAKDTESDQVLGLEMGADDYVTKPFSPLALIARVKAVTRRAHSLNDADRNIVETKYFKVNKSTREVYIDGKLIVNLTPKEYDLLLHFMQHPRQVFSREQLVETVWGYHFYGDDRTVDAHMKRLRKKIGEPFHICFQTVWGVGYKFEETDELENKLRLGNQDEN